MSKGFKKPCSTHVCLTLTQHSSDSLDPINIPLQHRSTLAKYQSCCLLLCFEWIFYFFSQAQGCTLLRFSNPVTVMLMRSEGRAEVFPLGQRGTVSSASQPEEVATLEIGENPQWAAGVPLQCYHIFPLYWIISISKEHNFFISKNKPTLS